MIDLKGENADHPVEAVWRMLDPNVKQDYIPARLFNVSSDLPGIQAVNFLKRHIGQVQSV